MKRNYFLVTVDYLDFQSTYVSYKMLLALIDKASSHLVSFKILARHHFICHLDKCIYDRVLHSFKH